MNKVFPELSVAVLLVALLGMLLNPFGWMPDMGLMIVLAVFAVAFTAFAAFVWRERARDERELMHRNATGRIAYLLGSAVLVLGIIVQTFVHELDPWLVYALGIMILGKSGGLFIDNSR